MKMKTYASFISLLLVVLSMAACQTPTMGPKAVVAPSATASAGGFTLNDSARLDSAHRSDFNKAVKAIQNGDNTEATELLAPIAEEPNSPIAVHVNLGIALRALDQFEASEKALRQAVEQNPKHPVALNELGITLRRLGQFDDAREQYEAALSQHPDFHFARKNLAILCDLYLSDLVCALSHYRRYVAADPGDEATNIWIADIENRLAAGKD